MNQNHKKRRPIKVLSQSQVNQRQTQIEELLLEAIGIESYLVTDLSALSHFLPSNIVDLYEMGLESREADFVYQEAPDGRAAFKSRVFRHCGFNLLEEHFSLPLWQLVDLLETARVQRQARWDGGFIFAAVYSVLQQTSYAAPWAWEGQTLEGYPLHILDRHNALRVQIDGKLVYVLSDAHPAGYWELSDDLERLEWIAAELEAKNIALFFGSPREAKRL